MRRSLSIVAFVVGVALAVIGGILHDGAVRALALLVDRPSADRPPIGALLGAACDAAIQADGMTAAAG